MSDNTIVKIVARIILPVFILSIFSSSYLPFLHLPTALAATANPSCSLDISPSLSQRSGESFDFSTTIGNLGPDTGFSPFIELVLPADVTLNSATFSLGALNLSPVSPSPITVTDNDGGSPTTGTVTNPITSATTVLPVGNIYRVYRLPLGSYANGQTPVSIDFNATLSSVPPINIPLVDQVKTRCGFSLGADPLDNPNVDPVAISSFVNSTITPTLLNATKTMVTVHGEDETATGPNFPVTYTIGSNISNTKVITNLQLLENLPNQEILSKITGVTGTASQIVFTPSSGPVQTYNSPFAFPININSTTAGGTLTALYPTVTGVSGGTSEATMTFEVYVPDKDLANTDILPQTTGGSTTINNVTTTSGLYLGNPVSDTLVAPIQLQARATAVQKGRSIFTNTGDAGFSPGDTVQYTVNFQVSDYFELEDYVLEDLIPDGLTYVAGSARLSYTQDGVTTPNLSFNESTQTEANRITGPAPYNFSAAPCSNTCTLAITPDTVGNSDGITPPGDGQTIMTFDISKILSNNSLPAELTGGLIGPTPTGQPTQGTITYRAVINESYINGQPNDKSIDADDTFDNTVSGSGEVRVSASPTGNFTSDGSSAAMTIVSPTFSKDIIALLPSGGTLDVKPFAVSSPLQIAPNDQATYKMVIDVPSGDLESMNITDYLPIPFFDANEIDTTFDTTIYTPTDAVGASVPPVGKVAYGSGTTGLPPITGLCTSFNPTISKNLTTNTFSLAYSNTNCFEKSPSTPIHLELLFTVSAQPKPMANSLRIVNMTTFTTDNSVASNVATDSSIIDIITNEPELAITKGIISSDQVSATYTPASTGPVAFTAPGTNPPFTGPFSSTELAANPIDSNISNVDAGDKVRFAVAVENFGLAKAYDVTMTDAVPVGFSAPSSVADLNLKVYDANGNDRTADTQGGLFGFQANGGNASGGNTSISLTSNISNYLLPLSAAALTTEGQANEGKNILIFVYELKLASSVQPQTIITNTAQLTNYSSVNGGQAYVDPTDPPEDDATTTTPAPTFTKKPQIAPAGDMTYTACATPANCNATIGEVVRYRLPIVMPEGTDTTLVLNDNIPTGLGYYITNSVTVDGTTANCPEATSNFNGTLPSVTVNSPIGVGVAASGVDLQTTFSNIITSDDNNLTNNTFCAFYDVVVLTNPASPFNKVNSATLTVNANPPSAAQTATVNVKEPKLRIVKSVSPTSGDAGNVVTYTLTISHTTGGASPSNVDATDISLSDVLPSVLDVDLLDPIENFATDGLDNDGDGSVDGADADETGGVFYNSGTKTFTFNKTTTNNASFDRLPLASSITLTFKAKMLTTVSPAQIIVNTANIAYDSIQGVSTTGVDKNGTNNGSANLNVLNISAGKTINSTNITSTGTSQHNGTNTDLTIGEQVVYRISVNVPESTTTNLQIIDTLPAKFRMDSAVLVSDATASPVPTIVLSDSDADLINDRATITFATVNPPGSPSGSNNSRLMEFDITATVLDNAANLNAQTKTNNVSLNWTGNPGAAVTASAVVDLVEPNLQIAKSYTANTGDAGDDITMTLQTSHTGLSTSSAYDTAMTDTVPSGMTIRPFGSDGIDNDNDASTDEPDEATLYLSAVVGQVVTFNNATTGNVLFNELPLATTITYRVGLTINNTVFPGQVINNTANLNYDSAPGANPDQRNYVGSSLAVFTVNSISIIKSVFATDLVDTGLSKFNPALEDLAIGETVTYRVSVPVPESVSNAFTVTDNLPPKFRVLSGSLIQDSGVSHSFTSPVISDTNADLINDRIVFNFGTVNNPPAPGTETIIVEIVAQVINDAANVAGTPYINTAELTYTELGGPAITSTATVDVVEPSLSITKSASTLVGDSGDQIEYTINISNTGTGSAYDLEAVDNPDNLLTVNTGFAADAIDNNGDGVDADANEVSGTFYDGDKFTWNFANTAESKFAKLDPGQSITLKYLVNISVGVTPNQVIGNTVDLDYDSWPGANPEQRAKTNSANAPITVSNNADIVKELRNGVTTKVIGDIIPYRVKVRVPEGTVNGLIIHDSLPAGLAYIPGSAIASSTNPGEVSWNGTPQSPAQTPLSTAVTTGNTQTLDFDFGDVINNNVDNLVDEQVIIEYDVAVLNTVDNLNSNTKVNSATADIGTAGTVGPSSAPTITIAEPVLSVQKTSTYTSGNIITYQISVENNSPYPSASAWDATVTDTLPAGVVYAGNFNLVNGPALPTINVSGAPVLTFDFSEISPVYNSGNPVIFTFDVTVPNTVAAGTLLTNNVDLKATSQSGAFTPTITGNNLSGERTGSTLDAGGVANTYHQTDNLPLTVTRPDLSTSFKTVTDLNGGNLEANDSLLYHIEVINTGNSTASGIHLIDNIPPNVHNFSITVLPATGVNNSLAEPAGTNSNGLLDFTNITLGTGGSPTDTVIIEYTVNLDIGLPDGTNIVNNFTVDPSIEGGPGGGGTVSTSSFFPILSLNKSVDGPSSLNIGEDANYLVVVSNSGSAPSTNTTLIDIIPPQLEYTPNSITVNTIGQTDAVDLDQANFDLTTPGAVTIVVPTIAIGQTITITYKAKPRTGTGGQTVNNTVNLSDDQGSVLSSSANISIKLSGGAGGPFGGGGGSGGGGTPTNNITSLFEDEQGNQRAETCENEVAAPEIIPTACLQLVPNRDLKFTDISGDDSYSPFINTLKNTQIIKTGDFVFSGTGNHSTGKQQSKFQTGDWEFQPDRQVTRLEAVKVALISNCIPVEEKISPPLNGFQFRDLPITDNSSTEVDDFAARVFYTAYKHGIVTGDNGFAQAYRNATTPEILAISLRASQAIPDKYNLVQGQWFEKYKEFAQDNGLLKNTTVENFQSPILRKDFAKLLVRVMAYNPDPNIYGYIERVNIKDQAYDWRTAVAAPKPDLSAFGEDAATHTCPVEKPVSCLEHDANRKLKFDDVPDESWAIPYIDILRTTKIIANGDYIASGHGNQSTGRQQSKYQSGQWFFQPDRYTTRLELTKMALVANCITVEDEVPIPANGFRFSDLPVEVDKSDDLNFFAARVFYTAYKHGVIKGVNLSEARPYDDATRAEVMTVLTRASKDTAKYTGAFELPYLDTSNEAWYARILSYAWENGIVGGSGDHTFKLERHVKRTEMAKLIYSFMLFNDNAAIRDYAQSLKDYYDLEDFKVKPGQIVQTTKQINPLKDQKEVERPLATTKSETPKETSAPTTSDTVQEPVSSGAEAPIGRFKDSTEAQESAPEAAGQTSSLPFTRKSS